MENVHISSVTFTNDELCTIPYKNERHWLVWKWNKLEYPIIWFISAVIPLIFLYKNKLTSLITLALLYVFITFILSHVLLPQNASVGSIWCFSQGGLPIVLLSYYMYKRFF